MAKGTVRYIELEGGFFGIVSADGEELAPVNLPAELQVDGLKVDFRSEDAMVFSMRMWGRAVKLASIERSSP